VLAIDVVNRLPLPPRRGLEVEFVGRCRAIEARDE
jgi:hypothetical protein